MPPDIFFGGAGLDRADAVRGDAGALARHVADPAARQLLWSGGFPALGEDGRLQWAPVKRPDLFLGMAGDGSARFSAVPEAVGDVRAAFASLGLLNPAEAPLFAAALSLGAWHVRHRFCANCGNDSAIVRGGWSRRCGACGAEHFPRVDPVVIMLAEHDGRLLLGRQPHYPPARYSALAGYVEVGEDIESAVVRELKEEAGITVEGVHYVASQPWPFPSSLMIGCHAIAQTDALTIDHTELDDARWFSRTEVMQAMRGEDGAAFLPPPPAAIARSLIAWWLAA